MAKRKVVGFYKKDGKTRPITARKNRFRVIFLPSGGKTIQNEPTHRKLPYSFRDYEIGLFGKMYKECKDSECQNRIREGYRGFEGGRWVKAMEDLHSFLYSLDQDEREKFKARFPNLVEVVNEYAEIEEVSKI